jgi:hypothetical protein
MSDQRKQILQMLADGKINADEAERLLSALEGSKGNATVESETIEGKGSKPKFLHIKVESEPGNDSGHENVDIKIPLILIKAGMKLGSLVPDSAKSKINAHLGEQGLNIDLNQLDGEKIDVILQALCESSIDVDSDKEKVRIYCC